MNNKAFSIMNLPSDAGLKGLSSGSDVRDVAGMLIEMPKQKPSKKRAASPLSDSSSSCNPNVKKVRTKEEKKMDRILANRRSARRSRERRKKLTENLEVSLTMLSKENHELSRENAILKHEIEIVRSLLIGRMSVTEPLNTAGLTGLLSPNNANATLLQKIAMEQLKLAQLSTITASQHSLESLLTSSTPSDSSRIYSSSM